MTPQIVALVEIVADAEQRVQSAFRDETAARQLNTAMFQLDLVMERWIAEHEEADSLANVLYMLLVTDDVDEALRLDPEAATAATNAVTN